MKIISWNVNGIRACFKNGMLNYPEIIEADILCLQEIKATEEQFPNELTECFPYQYIFPAQKKGYSGVAILCKEEPLNIWEGIGVEEFDIEGRSLTVEYENFILYNGYYPNGQRDHGRVPYKLEFSETVLQDALKLEKKRGKPVYLCGDFNTAHTENDLANPKTNKKTTGFLPIEREWMDRLVEQGFNDLFRHHNPELKNGHYTWWTYRGDCRQRNIGWRIDYFFTTKLGLGLSQNCFHLPEIGGSDHCPIGIEIKF